MVLRVGSPRGASYALTSPLPVTCLTCRLSELTQKEKQRTEGSRALPVRAQRRGGPGELERMGQKQEEDVGQAERPKVK